MAEGYSLTMKEQNDRIKYKERALRQLENARDYLMTYGWTKGSYFDGNKACMAGALKSVGTIGDMGITMSYLMRVIPLEAHKEGKHPVTAFNDAEKTTFNDVMEVFDNAIQLAKEER